MDPKKAQVIDRFTQAVSSHGLNLVNETKNAHGYAKESIMDFLVPNQANIEATNYFNHRLQKVSLNDGSSVAESRLQPVFQERIRKFIATKSDLLFQVKGREELRRGIDYGLDNNHEVLDLYSKVPPLEVFMGIPAHVKRWQLLKVMKEGDIVLGEVVSKRPFGIFVKLTALEFSKTRDFTDTNLEALCRTMDLDDKDSHREHKDPADGFLIGDCVRGVITNVCLEEERIAISFKSAKLPEQHQHLHLGLLEDVDRSEKRYDYSESKSYSEHLETHVGLNNARNIETLLDILGVDTNQSCSLLRSFQRFNYPEDEYFDALRKKQSAKWSMESTAKGVELFKGGDIKSALKYLEHALQIDGENVEALVARGALSANEGRYSMAINDFRQALSINHHHRNANRYLVQTLIAQGIQQEKNGLLTEASHSFKEALVLNPEQATAKERLENVKLSLSIKRQREEKRLNDESKDLKSKFSHVRQLIEEEQIRKKKKKKKEKKKRKKHRTEKKKKTRRRSRTSSNTDDSSSYESDSKSESPRKNNQGDYDEKGQKPDQKRISLKDVSYSTVDGGPVHQKKNGDEGKDVTHGESQGSLVNQRSSTLKKINTETTRRKRSHRSRSPSTSDEKCSPHRLQSLKTASKSREHRRKCSRSANRGSRSSSSSDNRSTGRSRRRSDHLRSRKLSRRDKRSRSGSRGSSHSRSSSSSESRSAGKPRRSDHSRSRKLSRRDKRSRSGSRGSSHSRSSSSSESRSAGKPRRSDHSRSRKLSRRDKRSRSGSRGSSHSRSRSSSSDRRPCDKSRSRKHSHREKRSHSTSRDENHSHVKSRRK